MNTSNQDLDSIKAVLEAVKRWKEVANVYDPDSDEAKQCGFEAVKLVYQHVKILDDFQRYFSGSVITQNVILWLKEIAARYFSSKQLIINIGSWGDYKAVVREDFITDLERWIKETSGGKARDNMQATSKTTKRKSEAIRDQVFICYSHKDKRWLDELQTHLKPYVRSGSVTAWSDEQIPPGAEWFEQIKRALAWAKVAVLWVTKDFLASGFIHEHELTPLVKKAEKGDVRITWIPVGACSYKETMLKDYQAAINPEKPLANMKKADRDKAWVGICKGIKKAVSR